MTEFMIAHFVNQLVVLIGQTLFVYLFALLVFKIPFHGSLPLAVLVTLLQGLCGMSFGNEFSFKNAWSHFLMIETHFLSQVLWLRHCVTSWPALSISLWAAFILICLSVAFYGPWREWTLSCVTSVTLCRKRLPSNRCETSWAEDGVLNDLRCLGASWSASDGFSSFLV